MKIFVINLEKDTARRAFMEKQLASLKLPYEFIKATDGYNLSEKEISQIYDPNMAQKLHGHQLSTTQIACTDSHRRIYEKIKSKKLPWALILEDDVCLDKKIVAVLQDDFVSTSKADWLQIDYLPFDLQFIKQWYKATKVRVGRQPLFIFYALIKLPVLLIWGLYEFTREVKSRKREPSAASFHRPLYLTGAYIITLAGVHKVLPLCTPIRYAADQMQNQARVQTNLVLRGVVPLLSKQDREQFQSNILYDNQ